jgi:hypothetical protein
MAVTHLWYGLSFVTLANKEADWDTDSVKTMLTTVTYVPNQDTHKYKSDVTNEVVGTGYTATGVAISPLTSAYATGTNIWNLDGADAAWTTATFTCRIGVTYDASPATDATRPLLSYVDMGADQTVSAANFTIQWAAAGIVQVTVS